VLSFINSHVVSTRAELDQFYSETQIGLLVAVDAALPHLENYYHDHYHEVTLAYASPSLFESPGFYLYRYADSAVVPIADLSALSDHEISAAISHNLYPEFVKFNPVTAHWHERHNRTFLVLMLVMEDFYLTPAQLELARGIRDRTGLNVTYSDNENNQILAMRYGLPDSLDSTMAVIVPAGQKHKKYMMSDPLTLENAVKFADAVRNGSVTQFWRSESLGLGKGEKDGLTIVSANSFLELIDAKKTFALAVCWPGNNFDSYKDATAIAKKVVAEGVYGKFSATANDWPIEDETFTSYPWLLMYVKGKRVYSRPLNESTYNIAIDLVGFFVLIFA
jgi:hypothetical protein